MTVITPKHSNYWNTHKKYTVGSSAGRTAKADTLAEAKRAGETIAKKEAWSGKWNVMYIPVSIRKQDAPGSMYYSKPLLTMFVPGRGSGVSRDKIIAEIKRREGVAPFKWAKGR